MEALTIRTHDPAETRACGERLGRAARGGEILCLVGELGTGKTVLVQGLARGLGVDESEPVTSPTFVLQSEYEGRLRLIHVDTYRLSAEALADEDAFERLDVFPDGEAGQTCVIAIEWADRVRDALPPDRLTIRIAHVNEHCRDLEPTPAGPASARWLADAWD